MGLDAEIIAIGPYNKSISNHLLYPPEYYNDVADGETVITKLCLCESTFRSGELADALGLDTWNLGEHVIDIRAIEWSSLQNLFPDDIEHFKELALNGFIFYYTPNG